jgi:hypothetical protein
MLNLPAWIPGIGDLTVESTYVRYFAGWTVNNFPPEAHYYGAIS